MAKSIHTKVHILTVISLSTFHVTQGVTISPAYAVVEADKGDSGVTLPCIYSTTSNISPQIEWYMNSPNTQERKKVMRVSSDGRSSGVGEFSNRVNRGESASLILLNPERKDSATYACEVIVTSDIPSFARALVNLTIKATGYGERNQSQWKGCNATLTTKQETGRPIQTNPWLATTVLSVIVCFILGMINTTHVGMNELKDGPRDTKIFLVARIIISLIVMTLCVTSMINMGFVAFSGCLSGSSYTYSATGYICGAVGLILLVVTVIGNYKLHPKSKSSKDPSTINIQGSLLRTLDSNA